MIRHGTPLGSLVSLSAGGFNGMAELQGSRLVYLRELKPGERALAALTDTDRPPRKMGLFCKICDRVRASV